ncbi:MAG: hypothetical protein WD940_01280 [Patescibacteria group bacterium]
MVEKREIELIPKEIEAAKTRESLVRKFRLGTIFFFLVSLLAFGGIFAFSWTLSSRLTELEQDAAVEETQIAQFSEIESQVLGLADKSAALNKILAERDYFSIALSATEASRPSNLRVAGLTVQKDKDTVTINGETQTYVILAAFLQNLVDPAKGGVLYTNAVLNSVNLNSSKGTAEFVIEATIKKNGLKVSLTEEVQP